MHQSVEKRERCGYPQTSLQPLAPVRNRGGTEEDKVVKTRSRRGGHPSARPGNPSERAPPPAAEREYVGARLGDPWRNGLTLLTISTETEQGGDEQ
jgi:hypothetical protein